MKLYGFPPSPNTRKVQAVAAHLGIALEFEFVDITKGESRTPQFLAMNPGGRTPVLVDGEFRLWESNAIMQYLASLKKNSLWPEDDRTRADIARWQFWQVAHWHEGCGGFLWENLVKKLLLGTATDPESLKRAEAAFHRDAPVLDAHLAKRQYLVNDTLTLADLAVASYLHYAAPAQLPLEAYMNIQAWYARIEVLPAWRETAPKM
ncbi:MAG TPA: glutathione S-transferase family protein [Burkholderiales bacterium]|nr:glutathione S-transferase family protein [Burkholderiales bacterium]